MNKISGIYKITNLINGEIYIGSSTDIYYRWKREKRKDGIGKKFKNAINEYGVENFKFEILEECNIEKLLEREQFYIDNYYLDKNGFFVDDVGYNICHKAGNTLGYKHTEANKEKMRGENNHLYGKGYLISGEKNPLSKLTDIQVKEIREKYSTGLYTTYQLEEEYNISNANVSLIINNKRWKDENYIVPNIKQIHYQHMQGEKHPNAKFSQEEIDIIRKENKLYKETKGKKGKTQKQLALEYNTVRTHITDIVNFKIWNKIGPS